jgi:hypothetical protein
VFEVAIPHEALGLRSREKASFFIEVLKGEVELERHPSTAAMSILVPDDQFEIENWSV